MSKAQEFDKIAALVDSSKGIGSVQMRTLRDAADASKLRAGICDEIQRELEARGIIHLPTKLPASQEAWVLLYRKGSKIARMIAEARAEPSAQMAEKLRQYADEDFARNELDRIRRVLTATHGALHELIYFSPLLQALAAEEDAALAAGIGNNSAIEDAS